MVFTEFVSGRRADHAPLVGGQAGRATDDWRRSFATLPAQARIGCPNPWLGYGPWSRPWSPAHPWVCIPAPCGATGGSSSPSQAGRGRNMHGLRGPAAGAAPAEAFRAQLHCQKIGRRPRMTTISVRKWMNENQPMVEADSNLIGRPGVVLHPMAHVVQKLRKLHPDPVCFNPDLPFALGQDAGPRPSSVHILTGYDLSIPSCDSVMSRPPTARAGRRPRLAGRGAPEDRLDWRVRPAETVETVELVEDAGRGPD